MKKMLRLVFAICALAMLLMLVSCDAGAPGSMGGMDFGGSFAPEKDSDAAAPDAAPGEDAEGGETDDDVKPDQVVLPSGMITAGAWVDNDNYQLWLDLFAQGEEVNGKFYHYTEPGSSWGFNSLKRIKVTVKNGDVAVAGATVIATDEAGKALFGAVTDAQGNAYIFTEENSGNITVTSGEGKAETQFTAEEREITVELSQNAEKLDVIEIMLVLDVTGSMGDEISFLKAELADVISKIEESNDDTVIKLALLFYRDTDDRVPFSYFDFENVSETSGMDKQQSALNSQHADGGGDYPEAVDEALEIAVSKQWSTGATTKIIFFVLDAPAHSGTKNIEKFGNAVKTAAEKGIRICPILCSGAAELTEYTMREAAIYTGGTFIFVTNDSGIGGSHHDPNLPNITVELLNSLMVRLVNGYHSGTFEPPVYWKDDPNLGTAN